jgi:type VI secretion system protein ImpC
MQWIRATDDTFCIAVLGDFLGEAPGDPGIEEVTWAPQRATPDSLMNLVGLRPRISLSAHPDEPGGEMEFSSLQSFDPGELFQKMALFGPLREAREAARRGPAHDAGSAAPPPKSAGSSGTESANLLDAILDVTQPQGEAPPPGTPEEIEAFVREVVRPHLVRDDADAKTRISAVDEAASRKVSELLHMPSFQRLEAIWRSLVFLLSQVDTTGKVRVYLVHLPRAALDRELAQGENPRGSRLFNLLSSPQLGAPGRRWALVAGAYEFGTGAEEVGRLQRIATIARGADVPWISAIGTGGKDEDPARGLEASLDESQKDWKRFRESPEAAWLGLTYPRFLLREPYGEGPRRVKSFAFREETTSHEDLLWGQGPFLPAALLAQGFAAGGWGFRPERHLDLSGMPLGNLPGGKGVSPTSLDVPLSPGEAGQLMEMGIMPLLGFPDRAGVRVGGIHSLTGPGTTLSSWWK